MIDPGPGRVGTLENFFYPETISSQSYAQFPDPILEIVVTWLLLLPIVGGVIARCTNYVTYHHIHIVTIFQMQSDQ